MKKTKFLITPANIRREMECFKHMEMDKEKIALLSDQEKVSRGFAACFGRYDDKNQFCVSKCKFRSGCVLGAPEGLKKPIPAPSHCKGFSKMRKAYLEERLQSAHLAGNERQVKEIEAELAMLGTGK